LNLSTWLYVALRLMLGATFLFSAYTKTLDFSSFELRLLDTGLVGWSWSAALGTALIAAEYLIGFYFISLLFRSKTYHLLTASFLAVFTLYLLALWASKGNDLNCGCMGETIAFTPLQAIIKNLLSLLFLYLIVQFEKSIPPYFEQKKPFQIGIFLLAGLSTALSMPPVFAHFPPALEDPRTLEYTLIEENGFYETPNFDFDRDQAYLLAFLSMRCGHCKVAAERLGSLHTALPSLPIFIVLNGDTNEVANYRSERGIGALPYTLLGAAPFMQLAGTSVPALYLVENHKITHELELYDLSANKLERLATPSSLLQMD
jgi:hypothetical protein